MLVKGATAKFQAITCTNADFLSINQTAVKVKNYKHV